MTREVALWCAIACLAGALRLAQIDFLLTNAEAAMALTSLAALQGESVIFSNPLFGWLQALLFAVFGASEASARLVAALSGVVLCLLPVALRPQLGRTRALIFATLLALSPTLWFISRETGGAILAWTLAFAAHCAWRAHRPALAAAAFGALLATGQDAIPPLIVMVLASSAAMPLDAVRSSARVAATALLVFVLSATALLMRPAGLGDAFNGYALWLRTLGGSESVSAGRLMLGLIISEPVIWLGAAFALAAFARARAAVRAEAAWLVWVAAGSGVLIVTASRSAALLAPLVIGMAGLSSAAYDALLASAQRWGSWRREGAVAAVALALLIYAGLGMWQYAGQGRSAWLVSVVVAALLIAALIAAGSLTMDYGAPLRGVALAGVAALSLYTFGVGIRMNHARPHNPAEPYRAQAADLDLAALQEVIRLISVRATGEPNALAVHLAEDAPAALRWALRDRRSFDAHEDAGVVLTPASEKPRVAGNFIGAAYAATAQAPLNEVRCVGLPQGGFDCWSLARWLAFRDAEVAHTDLWVLWLRDDVARRASGMR
ncbi:MAG: glycosyltransferase family 39 protein [Thermoflexales bacterium]